MKLFQEIAACRLSKYDWGTGLRKKWALEYSLVGTSGIKVSRMAFGTWRPLGHPKTSGRQVAALLSEAASNGINLFDTANVYGFGRAEEVIGQFLRKRDRTRFVVATKAGWTSGDGVNQGGLSRKNLHESLHGSLRALKTDYVDIFYCHGFDANVPVEEVAITLNNFIRQGKIMGWGTSGWPIAQLRATQAFCKRCGLAGPIVEQSCVNLLYQSRMREFTSFAKKSRMSLFAWGPLASGLLTGKHIGRIAKNSRLERSPRMAAEIMSRRNLSLAKKFVKLADDFEVKPSVLALAWLLQRGEITSVVMGASNQMQLSENLEAVHFSLDKSMRAEIDSIFARSRSEKA